MATQNPQDLLSKTPPASTPVSRGHDVRYVRLPNTSVLVFGMLECINQGQKVQRALIFTFISSREKNYRIWHTL